MCRVPLPVSFSPLPAKGSTKYFAMCQEPGKPTRERSWNTRQIPLTFPGQQYPQSLWSTWGHPADRKVDKMLWAAIKAPKVSQLASRPRTRSFVEIQADATRATSPHNHVPHRLKGSARGRFLLALRRFGQFRWAISKVGKRGQRSQDDRYTAVLHTAGPACLLPRLYWLTTDGVSLP